MSVIAKLSLNAIRDFGSGALYEMGCVCQNDLMAMYAESEEDKLFTKASPWGEARFHLGIGAEFPQAMVGDQFYAVLVAKDEPRPDGHPAGAFLSCPARIASRTEFGGESRQVEICSAYDVPAASALQRFTWRMSVDNPPAAAQLAPSDGWMLSLFKAGDFDRDSAIGAAHDVPREPAGSAAAELETA